MANVSYGKYLARLLVGSESAHVYRYLRCLRYCEYHYNNVGFMHEILYFFIKLNFIDWDLNIIYEFR